ncbi:MAG: aromatic ring-hydroxylating oxygenase subunit alpha [Actinomycetota bacterium]
MAIETTPSTAMMQTLPRDAYLSPDHFALEADRIFFREWFCVGRQESIPAAGDYLHVEVAGESVLILRTKADELRAFYNVCRHRGSRLVMDDEASGHFKGSIKCPYHAWTYGLEGDLRNAPFLTETDGLRRKELSLHPVAVDTWAGFVFVNLTPSDLTPRRSLARQLATISERTCNYPLAELRVGSRISYEVSANWKTIVENYNECYHCGSVHPELCEVVPAFKQDGGRELDWEAGVPHRDGATTFTFTGTTARAPFPGLSEAERVRHKGELIYPNLMLSLSADHVAAFTLWPWDAGHTRVDCDFLFHPDEIAKPGFDPADAVDFWDLVNRQDWQICESVQKGMSSRAFSFGYYAPMEDLSLDIRRYLADKLRDEAI